MASYIITKLFALTFAISFLSSSSVQAQLSPTFYAESCPNLQNVVSSVMAQVLPGDPILGAAILRLFFHDCFVNGCDASLLLDDTLTTTGEKNAPANQLSLRGFEVIDAMKFQVENLCPMVVSCADILALAAREGVKLLGGPSWEVQLGRRDARTTSLFAAIYNLPSPTDNITSLVQLFGSKNLSLQDLVALSGAHTIGDARCANFRSHIYGDGNVDQQFAFLRKQTCPIIGDDAFLAPLDVVSPTVFDNSYFRNLVSRRGLLHSDEQLFDNELTSGIVNLYAVNQKLFFEHFAAGMVKMGNMGPLTGTAGEIRKNCRMPN